ncbi:MAG TPA: rhodanese-like domain-containing protein [Candidatus Limnocylindrales bacterium]|nr:rhodanese-like domain-containing protein [Candidatus Limnocylindrales bacterium]
MTRALARILLLAFVAVAACTSTTAPPAGAESSPAALAATVTVADAAVLRDGGAFVLDVREPSEWAEGHIPGAVLIPLGELGSRLAEVPRDRQVVVVCRSGNRSAQGRDILLGAGFPAVTSLAGGMNDWASAGLPIDTGG